MGTVPGLAARPQGLLLDAMGTLIGLRRSVGAEYARAAARHGLALEAAALEAAFRQAYRQAPPLAFPGLGPEELAQAERHWWTARIHATFSALGVESLPGDLSRELFDRFAEAEPWQVYPEVPRLLEKWQGQGLKLAVVSNFDSRLIGLLEALGLAPWLDAVVISSSAGAAKPDPLPFRQAAQQLDLDPAVLWHVGDSREDGAGARAAGIPWVLVRRS